LCAPDRRPRLADRLVCPVRIRSRPTTRSCSGRSSTSSSASSGISPSPGRGIPVGLHTLGFVAETDEEAIDVQWPSYKEQFYGHFLADAIGRIPHEQRLTTIDLFGRQVIPRVRELLTAIRDEHDAGEATG
jgi:hypothetical protein